MKKSLLSYLKSPDCGSALTLSILESVGDDVISGALEDREGRIYPISQGIPRLLSGSMLREQHCEMDARDSQVTSYDKMPFLNLLGKVEIPMTARALGSTESDIVLEAGCGTGRMSITLSKCAGTLICIDFSFKSLLVNQRKLAQAGIDNVHLIQADLCHLPFVDGVFSRVLSCQVLEHVPTEDSRKTAIQELARVGRPDCPLVLSAYKHSVFTKVFGSKQGQHEGGIPYFRFTKPELRAVLETRFHVSGITGKLMYIYLAECKLRDSTADAKSAVLL